MDSERWKDRPTHHDFHIAGMRAEREYTNP